MTTEYVALSALAIQRGDDDNVQAILESEEVQSHQYIANSQKGELRVYSNDPSEEFQSAGVNCRHKHIHHHTLCPNCRQSPMSTSNAAARVSASTGGSPVVVARTGGNYQLETGKHYVQVGNDIRPLNSQTFNVAAPRAVAPAHSVGSYDGSYGHFPVQQPRETLRPEGQRPVPILPRTPDEIGVYGIEGFWDGMPKSWGAALWWLVCAGAIVQTMMALMCCVCWIRSLFDYHHRR